MTITQGFYLGKYEMTQEQWEAVMGTKPWSAGDLEQYNLPESPRQVAVGMSWEDAQEMIQRLNAAAGASFYRLPSEAEWEYACRAGTITLWSFGDDGSQLDEYAWYRNSTTGERTSHEVGLKSPNAWGLYDMHGNVWERVDDWFSSSYYGESPALDPPGPTSGRDRVIRGGAFNASADVVRTGRRNGNNPTFGEGTVGIRLVRTGPQTTPVIPRTWGQIKGAEPAQ